MKKILFLTMLAGAFTAVKAQNCNMQFTASPAPTIWSPLRYEFTNTTVAPTGPGLWATYMLFTQNTWMPGFYISNTHVFTLPGTYDVMAFMNVYDSLNNNVLVCSDTMIQQVVVTNQSNNYIAGDVYMDSTINIVPDSFPVWLIQHDSIANTLTAVDSAIIYSFYPHYQFNYVTGGNYLVKSAVPGQTPATQGWVPTYHDSSLYWGGAANIPHVNLPSTNINIWMQSGTVTSGPGFVGGNISSGAGKGTGTGVAHMLVFLRNNTTNKMIASTYTNGNGDYSFGNLAAGTYNVYPEDMNYETTPSAVLTVASGQTSNTGIDFVQTDEEIHPKNTLGISQLNKNDGIKIYPNPVNDLLYIDNKNGSFSDLTIVNTLGQTVKQARINKGINKIGIETLGSGIYYVIVKGADNARSMKITKK